MEDKSDNSECADKQMISEVLKTKDGDEELEEGETVSEDSTLSAASNNAPSSNNDDDEERNSDSSRRRKQRRSRSQSQSRSRDESDHGSWRKEDKRSHRRRRSASRSRSPKSSHSKSGPPEGRSWNRKSGPRRRSSSRKSSEESSDNGWSGESKTQRQSHYYDSYKYQEPNTTVMVRGLASHLTENDIREDVLLSGIRMKDVRLIRNHDTGTSRGFAFIEFDSIYDATTWMNEKQGVLKFQGQYQASLMYSTTRATGQNRVTEPEWVCEKCTAHNFKRRELCYKCNQLRPSMEPRDVDLYEELSLYPTSTIILSNLDTLTTEERVLQAFQCRPTVACIPIKSVKVAREPDTSISKGICYVEANNISDASYLFSLLTNDQLAIDGRTVSTFYGKTSSHATTEKRKNAAEIAVAAAQWTNNSSLSTNYSELNYSEPPCNEVKTETDVEKMAQYCAPLYAKTQEEYISHLDYYRQYYRQQMGQSATGSKDFQQPPQQSLQLQNQENPVVADEYKLKFSLRKPRQHSLQTSFCRSDNQFVSGTEQDASGNGYYYDPSSGLYYNSITQHFFDPVKQQYLYWNAEENKYVEISGSCKADENESSQVSISKDCVKMEVGKKKKVKKQDKVKDAKTLAKEMEKWAKTLNQKKDLSKLTPIDFNPPVSTFPPSSTFTSDCATESEASNQQFMYTIAEDIPTQHHQSTSTCSGTWSSVMDSNADNATICNESSRSSFIDENKLACLLCKRKFSSMELLQKHIKMSDLHKKNMATVCQSKEGPSSPSSSISYRDRAKERRKKFGNGADDVGKNELKDLYLHVKEDLSMTYRVKNPTVDGLKDDNIGNRMLQKMGWQEGQGLGRNNQGRLDIIMAERRAGKCGLGLRNLDSFDGDMDPQAKVRKITHARFQELA